MLKWSTSWRRCSSCQSSIHNMMSFDDPLFEVDKHTNFKRRKIDPVIPQTFGHQIPTDILAEIATFLPASDALRVASTCSCVFWKIRSRYCHKQRVHIKALLYDDPMARMDYEETKNQEEVKLWPIGFKRFLFATFEHVVGVCPCLVRFLPHHLAQKMLKLEIFEALIHRPYSWPTHRLPLPQNLQELKVGKSFNDSISIDWLPHNLTTLIFGTFFNQPAVNFPPNLKRLTFGNEFNRSLLECNFPSCLESLTFGEWFDQRIIGYQFPQNLKHLCLGNVLISLLSVVNFLLDWKVSLLGGVLINLSSGVNFRTA